jgi:hypothetical protein
MQGGARGRDRSFFALPAAFCFLSACCLAAICIDDPAWSMTNEAQGLRWGRGLRQRKGAVQQLLMRVGRVRRAIN